MITELTGHKLKEWQRCKRIHRIGLTHHISKWYPSSLLSACLRHAIFALSSGVDVKEASDRAVMFFLSAAREPGLDLPRGLDSYVLAMDYVAIIRNVLEYLSRVTLLKLFEIQPVLLEDDIMWKFLAHQDESGILHRWEFVDYIPEDPIEDLHSWEVFGDLAASEMPMQLHYMAIGRRSGSHQMSPWCRTYAHPRVANVYRFNKVSGEDLKESWKPVYFSDNQKNTSKAWVSWMESDNAIDPLVRHVNVRQVSDSDIQLFRRDVQYEVQQMKEVTPRTQPRSLPMSRYACDRPFPCPHQVFCYSQGETLDGLGIYKRVQPKPIDSVTMGV